MNKITCPYYANVRLFDYALKSLDKKTLIELCKAFNIELTTSKSRSREEIAKKLSYFAKKMTLHIDWIYD